jgi:hypothetical protein
VYVTENNNKLVEIKHLGKIEKSGDIVTLYYKNGDLMTESLDQFAADEGFDNWANFLKNSKYSASFINEEEHRQFYSIKPYEETSSLPKDKIDDLNDTYKHCK